MAKAPTLTTIATGYYSTTALNDNFDNIEAAFENTLSLDGSTPNAMNADLDMNGYSILNYGALSGDASSNAAIDAHLNTGTATTGQYLTWDGSDYDWITVTGLQTSDIGVTVQAYDAGLTNIAGLPTIADKMLYTTGTDTWDTATVTSFARTLLDDADAGTARTTLGVGTSDSPTFAGGTFNGNVGVNGTLNVDDTLAIDGAAPQITISETDIPNTHRIIATTGNLYVQAQDTDGTNDGTIVLSGYFANPAKLIQASTAQFTVTGNSSVNGNSVVLGDLTVDTTTLKVDSATNRVGVGTNSPAAALDVVGNARISANNKIYTDGGNLRLSADDNNTAAGSSVDILVDGLEVADFTLAGYLRFNKDNFSGGGICTQSLDSSLQIAGGNNAVNSGLNMDLSGPNDPAGAAGLLIRDNTTNIYNYVRSVGAHIWYTGGSERVRITSSGDVGIGTSTPGSALSVVGLPTTQTGLADGDIWLDSGALRTGSPDDAIILTPESYGADATAASDASTVISTFLGKCVSEEKMGLMAGQYRLDSAITFSMDGTSPGDHISLLGAGQNMRGIQVNNSTGGIHFTGTGAGRQHTVELRSLQFEPSTADSGYPFKVTGTAGGLSSQSAVIIDGVYVGARDEVADLDFNVGPSITGLYRPRINDLRIVQPIDASAVNKWAHGLDISDCYFPVVNDLWINVAQTTGGADIGLKFSGTTEEAGYFGNCVVNGADVGFYMERTGREPHFQWFGGHINAHEIGMQFNGVKYGIVDGVLMYSDNVPALTDYVDFLVEDADGLVFRNCQFRMDGGDKRHWKLEPKSGKTGAVVRNITIYLDQASLFAETTVAPIYCNGATNVTIVLPDEVSTFDFASYPEKLVEMGPSQDVSEVRIITQSGLRKFDDTNAYGPDFILDRVSASPANSDGLGRYVFTGRNSADEVVEYANISTKILDVTDSTEAGYVDVNAKFNGADLNVARFIRPAANGDTGLQITAREAGVNTLSAVKWVDATVNGQAGRFLFLPT